MRIDKSNLKFQKTALILGIVLFGLKSTAYYVTNSNAILTDALEGLVNIFGAAFGLFSLYYATLPKDKIIHTDTEKLNLFHRVLKEF